MNVWSHVYDPLGNIYASAAVAAVPAALLMVLIAVFNVRVHVSALIALAVALVVSVAMYGMPVRYAVAASLYGAGYGLFPIAWLLLNVIFVYQLTVHRGQFDVLRRSLAVIAPDPRVQVILIAFAFGAFLEGLSGFGAPVAITSAVLMQLGFRPLQAAGLSLVANTAPVAFGSLGIPLTTLQQVTDLDLHALSATVAGLLAAFSFFIPVLVVFMLAGRRGLMGVWPALLVAGTSFTVPQFLLAKYHGPWLAAPVAGLSCIGALALLLKFWSPTPALRFNASGELVAVDLAMSQASPAEMNSSPSETTRQVVLAWLPWGVLTLLILIWGFPQVQAVLDRILPAQFNMPWLNNLTRRVPPIEPDRALPIKAVFKFHLAAATGTGTFVAAVLIGVLNRYSIREWLDVYGRTAWRIRLPMLTIMAMLALGNLIRYSGADGTLGLAFAHTGRLFPFFGTLLGWVGAAITGSDTSVNVLFGSLQKITAQQLGISAVLMGAANTCGGVMGKMISSQSIVVATAATNSYGQEGKILRYVLQTSIVLATLMAALVLLAAYVHPFTAIVAHGIGFER